MLSEEEQREWKELARSERLREDCELVRRLSRRRASACSIDEYVAFLNLFPQIQAFQPPPRPFPIYTNVRL